MKIKLHPGVSTSAYLALLLAVPFCYLMLFSEIRLELLLAGLLFVSFMFLTIWFSLTVTITIDSENLSIRYLNYHFCDKLENLYPEISHKFNFLENANLGLKKFFLGTNIKGFRVGWFTLKNKQPGFVCLTRKENARAIKAKDGCYLLLDPSVARKLAASIQNSQNHSLS